VTEEFDEDFHVKEFSELARGLSGYTERCVISFLDLYKKTVRNMKPLGKAVMSEEVMLRMVESLASIATENGLDLETCSEKIDLMTPFGIRHGRCIDGDLISRIIGRGLNVKKDPHQRPECGCATSVDIGAYNTCPHGCLYCYANFNKRKVEEQIRLHMPNSPLLMGEPGPDDTITIRKIV